MLCHKISVCCLTFACLSTSGLVVDGSSRLLLAQSSVEAAPLAIPEGDPLLPAGKINREPSPLEKKRIRTEIKSLEKQALNQLNQGDRNGAFVLWFRQLRLHRAIDLNGEIQALGNVGEIAWQNNLSAELRVINQRLDMIALQLNKNSDRDLSSQNSETLTDLANAYRQVRDLDQAIATFKQLLTQARQLDDIDLEQKYLNKLGKLYLGKFAYAEAASVYQELLQLSQLENDLNPAQSAPQVATYYQQLGQIYNYLQQPEQAIAVKQELIDYYQQQNQTERLGKTQISLGDDYRSVENFSLAIANYNEAAELGKSSLQLSLASEALSKLSSLYLQTKEYTLAIQATQELISTEIEADNSYGLLTSYEQLGKIYLQLKDYPQALNIFTQALALSRSLNYQTDYFNDLVDNLQTKVRR